MFSHVVVGSNDLEKSKIFYDAILGALGYGEGVPDQHTPGRLFYMSETGALCVFTPIDGQAATHANGGTIGFLCPSTERVDAWHAAGLGAGGKAIEDPPGWRKTTFIDGQYLAYLRDPDGNKLCALYLVPPQ